MREPATSPLVRALLAAAAFALSIGIDGDARATQLDPNVTEQSYVFVGSNITAIAWAPDGSNRLFVTRKNGEVRVVKNGALLTQPFATLTPIYTASECGLIGIAFDHDFINNQYVYLFVTVSASEQQIIRYTASGDVGTAKTTILPGLPTVGANHDGGALGVGPDNKLYFAIGDLGNGTGVDANLTTLASKVGRANLDGSVPNDNPFFDGGGPNNDYIWARGFRNPFSLAFQPANDRLWLNVVGTSYEQIFIVGKGDHGGWNDFENNQPVNGYIQPVIQYRTGQAQTFTIAATGGAVRNNNVITFTTTAAHRLRRGGKVTIAGVADTSFNGSYYIAGAPLDPTATTFTVNQNGANASSGGGTVTTLNQGASVVGGVFYDGTQFPAAYRGNYFYSDYVSNRVMRATLDNTNTFVTSVDYYATNIGTAIDNAVGPDGALYMASLGGTIYRVTYNATSQGIVVSRQNVTMLEGGAAAFNVRLQSAPNGNVTVNIARTAGDADIGVSAGAQLTFTAQTWSVPQVVTLAAVQDFDTTDDVATFSVSSTGLPTETVRVRAIDDDSQGLVLSQSTLTINEGGNGMFTVALASQPSGNVAVTVARTAGDTDVSVAAGASLTFTPGNWNVPQPVTIAAAEDVDLIDDTATISASAAGAATRTVAVTVKDNDASAPMITTTPVTKGVVGAPYTYDVNATGLPAPTYALPAAPAGMTINATTGVISWTPSMTGNFNVTVRAANGVSPDATQSYVIMVTADMPPTCVLTKPAAGEVISGTMSEFFGDGVDDVGTTRAEFYVDNALASTDTNNSGHYHFGGAHNLFDTTKYADGDHTLRMTAYDTKNQSCSAQAMVKIQNSTPDLLMSPPDLKAPADLAITPAMDLTMMPAGDGAVPQPDAAVPQPDGGTSMPPGGCSCDIGGTHTAPISLLTPFALLLGFALRRRARKAR